MASLGSFSLGLALLLAVYGIGSLLYGIAKGDRRFVLSGRGVTLAMALAITAAVMSLLYLLLSSDFSIDYVVQETSRNLNPFYKASALWGGDAGSMLFWVWVLSLYTAYLALRRQVGGEDMVPHATVVLLLIAFFFLVMLNFRVSPFAPAKGVYFDGYGMNPLLQNIGMFFHPVTTYLGYVGLSVPFAFGIAALIRKRSDDAWIRLTRRWTLLAWAFLTMGLVLGAQWAYVELGWGGYWGWDPVENALLMPWLTSTAFLHSVMIQEKRGMLKGWNIFLIILSFLLTIFGTFLTRSGVLSSVHAFTNTGLGPYFLVFLLVVTVLSVGIVLARRGYLREENQLDSLLSKESTFLLNNLLFVGMAFVVFWGTVYPIIVKFFTGQSETVGASFFNVAFAPIFVVLVFLMGVGPLIAWRRSSWHSLKVNFLAPGIATVAAFVLFILLGIRNLAVAITMAGVFFVAVTVVLEYYRGWVVRTRTTGERGLTALGRLMARNPRRYGGYLVHLGIVILVIGVAFSHAYQVTVEKNVTTGESFRVDSYRVRYTGNHEAFQGNSQVIWSDLEVSSPQGPVGVLKPAEVIYMGQTQPMARVAIRSGWLGDLYAILSGVEGAGRASLQVLVNPMVDWIWAGAAVMIVGTLIALWYRQTVSRG